MAPAALASAPPLEVRDCGATRREAREESNIRKRTHVIGASRTPLQVGVLTRVVLSLLAGWQYADADTVRSWPQEYLSWTAPQAREEPGTLAVVLRFPAFIRSGDEGAFFDAYTEKLFPNGNSGESFKKEVLPGTIPLLLNKTAFHAFELWACLRERGAEHYVIVLEPATVGNVNGEWRYVSEPRPVKAALVVDFFAYVASHSSLILSSTFGAKYYPVVSIRASSLASPETGGAVVVPGDWFGLISPAAPVHSQGDARDGSGVSIVEYLNTRAGKSAFGFVSAWRKKKGAVPEQQINDSRSFVAGKVIRLPDLFLSLDLADDGAMRARGEIENTCIGIDNLTRAATSILDLDSVAHSYGTTLRHGAQLDEMAPTSADLSRWRKMLAAEIKFLAHQDERLASILLTDSYMQSFFALRKAEVSAASRGNIVQMLAASAMLAGTVSGAGNLFPTAVGLLDVAADEAERGSVRSAGLYSMLSEMTMEIVVEGESIQAESYMELRAKVQELERRH